VKISAAHRYLGPRDLDLESKSEARKSVARRMAFSLDVEVVLLDIGMLVPLSLSPLKTNGERRESTTSVTCITAADSMCRGDRVSHQLRQRCIGEQGFSTLHRLLPSRHLQ
jgi:hypothetical protein